MTASKPNRLRFGPLGANCRHICVDMQRMFQESTPWQTPWMKRIVPKVRSIAAEHASQTIFTRFIPPMRPDDATGSWLRYYKHWSSMTIEKLGYDMLQIVPDLADLMPPAEVADKGVFSPWQQPDLHDKLREHDVDTLIISGGETDICVLATVLGAVDLGYRVVIVTDALCSSSDETHDALLKLYETRFGQQVEAVTTEVIIKSWPTISPLAP